ncbi:DeoR/GlpR family DNA-binding transcription regulator [Afifella sp. IM 167]|uniref:DeoR/GlpR family DNA-binding transcription regulator n=1 Tax=Afifella sp. IM 167 TaxID=2033586 RepID=UPI001CCF4FF8|nr:DeoR/GlpR family DNA-binding transcription regulator [Afifella sp. IM 167]MBZ8133682.1 transcriptional regulator [Afifella sp. IM 167]
MIENLHDPNVPGERRELILTALRQDGFVTIDVLSQRFGCSAQTVRRDLIAMEAAGLLKRFHGGASPAEAAARPSYRDKRERHTAAKQEIAAAAVALVASGESFFLDVGTTIEALAQALRAAFDAGGLSEGRAVCAGLNAASILAGARGLAVEILPGEVRTPDGAITGASAALALSGLRLDHAFLGASAVDEEGAPWDFDPAKIAVKQAAIEAARDAWVLADTSKFSRSAPRRLCRVRALRGIVLEAGPPARAAAALEAAGCALVLPVKDRQAGRLSA